MWRQQRGGGLILVHGLSGFGPWPAGSIAFGPVTQQNIRVERRVRQSRDTLSVAFPVAVRKPLKKEKPILVHRLRVQHYMGKAWQPECKEYSGNGFSSPACPPSFHQWQGYPSTGLVGSLIFLEVIHLGH